MWLQDVCKQLPGPDALSFSHLYFVNERELVSPQSQNKTRRLNLVLCVHLEPITLTQVSISKDYFRSATERDNSTQTTGKYTMGDTYNEHWRGNIFITVI